MPSSKNSIDEILLEAGMEAESRKQPPDSSGDVDIDSLLASILREKEAPPSRERPPEEDPTKIFHQRAKRRTAPRAAAAQQPPEPKSASNLPPIFRHSPEDSGAGGADEIRIDVDKIRAEQPAPRPIPAQTLPEDSEPRRIRPAEKVRERAAEAPSPEPSAQFAPPFRRTGKRVQEAPPSAQAGLLGAASRTCLIYGAVMQFGFQLKVNYLFLAIYGLLGSLVSQLGDLSFSYIKRQYGLKDFGNIFPGHGGVLDRFDSVIFCAPLIEILIYWMPALSV